MLATNFADLHGFWLLNVKLCVLRVLCVELLNSFLGKGALHYVARLILVNIKTFHKDLFYQQKATLYIFKIDHM